MADPQKLDADADAAAATSARRWLESLAAKGKGYIRNELPPWEGRAFFDSVSLCELVVSRAAGGRVLCSFRVPSHLAQDADGNWSAGAIATAIDDVGGAAVMTAFGHFKVSVDYAISFFSPAKIDEEVEIDARVVENKGILSAVVVEVRKKGGGDGRQLVATGREWVASARPAAQRRQRSKL